MDAIIAIPTWEKLNSGQDCIVWEQQLSQEISKIQGTNSQMASVALSNLWYLQHSGCWNELCELTTYKELVDWLEDMPGCVPLL